MNYKHNKETVVNKGIELFWEKGFHNLGVNEICSKTRMTKGAFYNAFKSKEFFLIKTVESYSNDIVLYLENQLSQKNQSAYQKLVDLYESMLKAQPESNFRGCLVNNIMSEMGAVNINVAEMTTKQFSRFLSVIEPTVLEAQKDGDLNNQLSSKLLSEIIHTTFFGLLTRSKSTKTSHHKIMNSFFKIIN